MILSKTSQLTLFLNHVYFPLGTLLHHAFCVFTFLHPLAVKVPIFFVSAPAVYLTLGD